MENNIKNRKNKFLAFLLSILMVTSTAVALASCTDNDTTSESTSEETEEEEETTKNDDSPVKNGNFTLNDVDIEDGTPIVTSVSNWTRSLNSVTSGSAPSSKAASGIVDFSKWEELTGSYFENPDDVKNLTEADAIDKWDKLTVRDKLAYYEVWEEQNEDGDIEDDFEKYESFNIDVDDVPAISAFDAKTHYSDGDANTDTNVLMIHNQNPETDATNPAYASLGTAQKYTSSSTVTVPAGASVQFSVWVRTQDLTCTSSSGVEQEAVGKGAYISVTHSVGSKSLPAYEIKNINTETMDASNLTNGWAQYTFYLKGSSYSSTTFNLVLGLGQGGGTDRLDYVNGYAFFDDIECKVITNDVYDDVYKANKGSANVRNATDFNATKAEKTVDLYKYSALNEFYMDYYGEFKGVKVLDGIQPEATANDDGYTALAGTTLAPWLGEGRDGSEDVTEVYANNETLKAAVESAKNEYLTSVYDSYLKDSPFNAPTLLLLSADGVAYTAESGYKFGFVDDNGTATTDDDETYDYIAVSFFVKTSDLKGYTGAGITLVDGKNETSFSSIDTSDITLVTIGDNEDYYDGWQQCFFFVKNDSEKDDLTFSLKFNFGPTDIDTSSTLESFHIGFAAFTNFQSYYMSKQEYESVSTGTYAKTVSVTGEKEETAAGNSGFDSAVAVSGITHTKLEDGIAQPQNYKGVTSESAYITGTGSDTSYSEYANAGLLNREYFTGDESYYSSTSTKAWMQGITKIAQNADSAIDLTDTKAVWASVFENSTQPLFIYNDGSLNNYGFIGSSTTISASSCVAVSVRVKVGSTTSGSNAVANIYLVDTSSDSRSETLSIGRKVTYWYDENGNILSGDPDEKGTMIALTLEDNGLYKINPKWATKKGLTFSEAQLNAYYANLQAYTELDENQNKLVGENGASHAYSDYWYNEGEDGIAFYYRESDGKYCADRAETLPVTDLSELTELSARYGVVENKKLMATVTDTNGEWATVTFYVQTGETAKNYRLEVWLGDRTNETKTSEGAYAIFDTNNPGTASDNFSSLIEEYEDSVSDEDKFESVFSYYDSENYLRYNSEIDENDVGDTYKANISVTEEAGYAYLKYVEDYDQTIFADYSYTDKTVAAVVEDDDSDDDSSSSSDDDDDSEVNPLLLASSIAVAGVLVAVIIIIAVRKFMDYVRKNRGVAQAVKPKKEKKVKEKKASKPEKEEVDEDSPYND